MMPAAQRPPLTVIDGTRFGKYRLLGELAHGGMARIFLATIDGPGGFVKPCVIKKILPKLGQLGDFNRMFVNEARIAALLSHPNIVQAFDFGQVGAEYYLALEWVEGASLSMVLRETGRRQITPGLNVTLQVGIALCDALGYAHAARGPDGEYLGIVHRDVTPGNILVASTGSVKLTDFGIVKSAIGAVLSRPDVLKGKAAYMSPEQARCEPLDGRSDLYSLALVLYELATGQRPLQRATLPESLAAAAEPSIAPPSQHAPVPERLDQILMRALSPNPRDRHPNAKALQADLEAFRAEQHWTSATDDLNALLRTLFPDGMPTRLPATGRSLAGGAGVASPPADEVTGAEGLSREAAGAVSELLESGEFDVLPENESSMPTSPPSHPPSLAEVWGVEWREVVLVAGIALVASASFWLFALP